MGWGSHKLGGCRGRGMQYNYQVRNETSSYLKVRDHIIAIIPADVGINNRLASELHRVWLRAHGIFRYEKDIIYFPLLEEQVRELVQRTRL